MILEVNVEKDKFKQFRNDKERVIVLMFLVFYFSHCTNEFRDLEFYYFLHAFFFFPLPLVKFAVNTSNVNSLLEFEKKKWILNCCILRKL